jgi:hypothetical protein
MLGRSLSWLPAALAAIVVISTERPARADEPEAPPPASPASDETPSPKLDEVESHLGPAPTPRPSPAMKREWYGWQTLLVDSVALGTVPLELGTSASFAKTPSATYLLVGSLSGYVFGSPLVHAAHGHWQRGLADFGLHAGALALGSLLGGVAGGAPSSCNTNLAGCLTESTNGVLAGAMLGAVLASVVDASFLGWDAKPAEVATDHSARWSPMAGMTRGGGVAGIQGSF